MILGITGQIGSGKSEVAALLKKYGAFVISADKVGRQVVDGDIRILNKLVSKFGQDIITRGGRLRRRRLGEIAFSSEKNKKILNSIVHPPLLSELARQTEIASRKYEMVAIDAALLLDWKWDKKVDYTVLVHAPIKTQIDRLVKKGYTLSEARMRQKTQMKYSEMRKRADFVILNNGSLAELDRKVNRLIKKLH